MPIPTFNTKFLQSYFSPSRMNKGMNDNSDHQPTRMQRQRQAVLDQQSADRERAKEKAKAKAKARAQRKAELEKKVYEQNKKAGVHASPSPLKALNDLQNVDTPESRELARMNREDEAAESAYINSLPWWRRASAWLQIAMGTTGADMLAPTSMGGNVAKVVMAQSNPTQQTISLAKKNLLSSHLQGDDAIKMFKEYGGTKIPETSDLGKQLRLYVPEARERYGLMGNKNISDEEIAEALYKHVKELGKDSKAVNSQGEPQLLFRGDTKNYTTLRPSMSPEELATKKGTMDNSLGTLFTGEFPGTFGDRFDAVGSSRYLHGSYYNPISNSWQHRQSATGSYQPGLGYTRSYRMFFNNKGYRGQFQGFSKDLSTEENPNWLNAFVVKTPEVRDATKEISVLNDDGLLSGAKWAGSPTYKGIKYKFSPESFSMVDTKTGKSLGKITDGNAVESRLAVADHYTQVLKDAESKNQGLLKSNNDSPLRDEHTAYSYFAVPNFNLRNVKHILPYDLRIPTNWADPNIFRVEANPTGQTLNLAKEDLTKVSDAQWDDQMGQTQQYNNTNSLFGKNTDYRQMFSNPVFSFKGSLKAK